MTYEQFNTFCDSLPATSYVMQWGNSHVWKVGAVRGEGGKVFAIGGWKEGDYPGITFKVSRDEFDFLKDREGFRPAPYLASRGMSWIQQYGTTPENLDDEVLYYLKESHRIVSLGLTKKKQKELGLNQDC